MDFSQAAVGQTGTACPRLLNHLRVHHSNAGWNDEKLLILLEILDSIFRWNDETTVKLSIIRQIENVCPPPSIKKQYYFSLLYRSLLHQRHLLLKAVLSSI